MSAASESFDRAFWQAIDDLQAGTPRPMETYLALVPRDQRDDLARTLADVLLARGPAMASSDEESESYDRALSAIDEVLGQTAAAGMLPGALRTMRRARGIDADAVVSALASDFEISGGAGRKALERNYHSLETGKLLGSKLAHRLLESLARVFEIDVRDLIAGAQSSAPIPGLKSAPAMGRASRSAPTPGHGQSPSRFGPDPEVERVEQLFHGGSDG